MKVAVLGISSFVGRSVLPALLRAGCHVTGFSRRRPENLPGLSEWQKFDLPEAAASASELAGFDAIIYAVAAGVQARDKVTPAALYYANAAYPARLLAELDGRGYRGRWISFGSYFEIGDGATVAMSETEVLTSTRAVPNLYCDSKRSLSRTIAYGAWHSTIHHFILPTIYGVGEDGSRLIPYLVEALRRGEQPALSAGTQVRQYLEIGDVASLLLLALEGRVPVGVFNAAPAQPHSIREVVNAVFAAAGTAASPVFGAISTRDQSMQFLGLDAGALQTSSPWRAQVALEAGIQRYFARP